MIWCVEKGDVLVWTPSYITLWKRTHQRTCQTCWVTLQLWIKRTHHTKMWWMQNTIVWQTALFIKKHTKWSKRVIRKLNSRWDTRQGSKGDDYRGSKLGSKFRVNNIYKKLSPNRILSGSLRWSLSSDLR